MGVVLILDKKRDGRIVVLFSIFALLVGSILVVGAVSLNNNPRPIINDIVVVDKFNHLKGFKQIGFSIDYNNIAVESFNKEILATSGNKISNKFSSGNIEVESIYEEIDTSFFNVDEKPVKQIYIMRNLLSADKSARLNILYEIGSDFVVWNGTKYAITNEPVYFKAFEVTKEIFPGLNETFLTGHILTFGNNYYDFKDITDLNYTISVYSLNSKNYINLEISQEIDGLGEFVIDPVIGWTTHNISTDTAGGVYLYAIDIDSDDDIDVVSAFRHSDYAVVWYENNGGSPPNWTTRIIDSQVSAPVTSVFAIDLDNDTDTDVLRGSSDQIIRWYENDGNSPPSWTNRELANVDITVSVYAIDIDNDTDIDVVSVSTGIPNRVYWFENNGSSPPSWTTRTISSSVNEPVSVYAVDIDNDTDIDVLSASQGDNKIIWFENNGSSPPSWINRTITNTAIIANSVFAIDIDNDRDMDVLSASSGDNKTAWYENDGGSPPDWTTHVITTSSIGANSVYAIDMDNDSDIDVLSASAGDGKIAWYENDGSSPPNWTTHNITTTTNQDSSVFAIDIDNDNDIDVLSTSRVTAITYTTVWYESDLTPRNSTDLEILEIIPIQVVRDVDMIKGKTGIVRVVVKNNGPLDANATVDVTFEGDLLKDWDTDSLTSLNKTINVNMNESFDFRFKPAQTGTQTFSAEVSVS